MGLSHEILFDTVIIGVCLSIAIIITHRDPGDRNDQERFRR